MKKPNEGSSGETPNDSQARVDKEHVSKNTENDPLLAARGSGRELWRDDHADEYVRRLRESWD